MTAYTCMDAILTFSGNRLSSRLFGFRKLGTICNFFMRSLILTASTTFVLSSLFHTSKNQTLDLLQSMTYLMSGLLATILFAIRRTQIKSLIQSIALEGTNDRIEKMALLFLIFKVATMALDYVATMLRLVMGERMAITQTMIAASSLIVHTNHYLINYPLVYVIVMRVLASSQVKELRTIRHLVGKKEPLVLTHCVKRVSAVRQEFERLLNFIPFTLFAVLFVSIPDAVTSIAKLSTTVPGSLVARFALHQVLQLQAAIILIIFLVVYYACKSKEEMDEAAAEVMDYLNERFHKNLETIGYQTLTQSLKEYQNFSFTGWTLFTIDRQLILTFLSSVISFSVLLIQLQSALY